MVSLARKLEFATLVVLAASVYLPWLAVDWLRRWIAGRRP